MTEQMIREVSNRGESKRERGKQLVAIRGKGL